MRIGVMGAHDGHIGGMMRSALDASNVEMVGIVEDSDPHYERFTRERHIPRYESLDQMISEARPELIIEGLNHAEKTELVVKAANAGIHLLLDKPLCRTMQDWEQMKAAVGKNGIKVSMWYTSRDYAPFVKLREHILSGDLGDMVSFISTHPHKLGKNRPNWYFDPNVYTGVFHDLACHGVDLIRWLTGADYTGVHAVASTMREHPGPFVDHTQASFTMSNGASAVLTADWLTPNVSPSFGDTRFIIMGTKGSAHLRAYAANDLLIVSDTIGIIDPDIHNVRVRPFVEQMVDALERGEEHFISTADVFAVAKACLIAQQSAEAGGTFLPIV